MTDSPFIDGTHKQWAWDSTSLGWFKDCPRKYQYSMIEGWREGGNTSVHLKFGLVYHSSLEHYDHCRAMQQTHEQALQNAVHAALIDTWEACSCNGLLSQCPDCDGKGGNPWQSGHSAKNRFSLIRSIVWYIDQFKDDPAATVILEGGEPAVELSFKFPAGFQVSDTDIVLTGHLDRIVEFQGFYYVTDRKTTGTTLGQFYFENFDLDGQMSQYTLAGQVVLKSPIKGVMIDAAQVAVGFSRYSRGFTYRTPAQLEEYLQNTQIWIAQAHAHADAGHWPLNERSCRLCAFKGICSKDPSVRERFLESDFEKRHWNPLEVR